jgi:quercetin dioxygenase-like cupin family protein
MKTQYHQILLPVALLTLSWSSLSTAQDAVSVDPRHHKVEFENAHVRVLRIAFAPGESSQMHSHPCAIAVGVSDSVLTFHLPDGSTRPARLQLGQVVVAKPQTHNPENTSPTAAEVILVEMKDGGC